MMDITFGSVCSGIEAASVAWHPLGWRAAWLSEIEPFPCAVLAHHYPDVPNLGDMTTIAARVRSGDVPAPDVLTGGTPCQAFSVAGLRQSLDDARGNLSLTFCELADAIDDVRRRRGEPECVVIWENVPGVLNTKDNAFGCFLGALAGCDTALVPLAATRWTDAGVVVGPRRAVAWRILDAQFFGLAQRRRRVFVVSSARAGFDPAAVLLEFEGVRRDTAPRREAGQAAAEVAAHGADGSVSVGPCVSPALKARDYKGPSSDGDGDGAPLIAHSLRGEGFDASEYGTGRGTPLVPVGVRECAPILTTNYGKQPDGSDTSSGPMLVPMAHAFDARQSDVIQYGDMSGPLDTDGHTVGVLAFSSKDHGADACADLAPTLRAMGHAGSHANGGGQVAVQTAMQVRRLTPREGERLQGFPESTFTLAIEVCADESSESVSCAGLDSAAQRREQSAPVVARVLIDCERLQVLQPSAGRSMSNALSAVAQSESRQPTLTGDFARLAALTLQGLEQEIRAGRAGSLPSISGSTRPLSGSAHARLSGRVIAELVSDAERLTKDASLCMKSITSQLGRNSQSFGSTLEISLCCVAAAIVSSIPKTTQPRSSFVVIVEMTTPYTLIPWRGKPAADCPDGPRYKALGNSWAVPCARWIGARITVALQGLTPWTS